MTTKTCTKCKVEYDISHFRKPGHGSHCLSCRRIQNKESYHRCRDETCIRRNSKYKANAESQRNKARDSYHKNRVKIAERRKAKRLNDVWLIADRTRASLNQALRKFGFKKDSHTAQYVGLTWEQFLVYLGPRHIDDVHLDHICPLAQACTGEEVLKLFHYTNLRWMPAYDNISKGDGRTEEGETLCIQLLGRPWQEEFSYGKYKTTATNKN